jgi:thiosulfate/3-mercaptopyruvate sulfurtransferase
MTNTSSLVSTQWLASHLDQPNLIIIDCRFQLMDPHWGKQQYQAGHIPGAYYLDLNQDLSSPVQQHGGRHPLPDLTAFAQKMAEIGVIWGETLVVAYDDARFAFASRLWWLLRYLGHDQVALLDGGWPAWKQENLPISSETPQPKPGKFTSQPQPNWLADLERVKICEQDDSLFLIDSRESDRYLGKTEPIDPIAGHIPGAYNLPWKEVSDDHGFCLPLESHQKRWQPYQEREIIVYCGSGVTACVNLFSLHLAGVENAKLYVGGWSDWCSYQ